MLPADHTMCKAIVSAGQSSMGSWSCTAYSKGGTKPQGHRPQVMQQMLKAGAHVQPGTHIRSGLPCLLC